MRARMVGKERIRTCSSGPMNPLMIMVAFREFGGYNQRYFSDDTRIKGKRMQTNSRCSGWPYC